MEAKCSDCLDSFKLTTEYWHRNKTRKSGYSNTCKKCKSSRNKAKYKAKYGKMELSEYAVYKGEQLLAIGTVKELAKELNTEERTIRYYGMPSYLKKIEGKDNRRVTVKL